MKGLAVVTLLLLGLLTSSPAEAQMLPVTTKSKEARERFEQGRHAAFHYQFRQAREHLDAAIAADPTFVLAYLHRGGSSAARDRKRYFDLAQRHRRAVSQDEQRMVDAFHAFLWDDEIERAVTIFQELSAKYPDDPYLPSYLGLRYYRNLWRLDDAKKQFELAAARDPKFAQAHNWLGYVALDQKDYATAERAFRRYLALAPDEPRPYDSLGELFLRTDRLDEAAVQFELALARDPDFIVSMEKLARVQITRSNARLKDAVGKKDATALAALYTNDAELVRSGARTVRGTDAIQRFWREAFASGVLGVTLETNELFLGTEGNYATEVGHYSLSGKGAHVGAGRYVVIWEHTREGWRVHRAQWTDEAAAKAPVTRTQPPR